jgi:hypothetical protein
VNQAQRKQLDAIKDILRAVHFPERWITDQTAICLRALIDRTPRLDLLPGKTSLRDGARIRNILDFARYDLNKPVAENTRESYRKQSLKPLYEAGIIELHQTSVNDPHTFYTINPDFEHILIERRPVQRAKLIAEWNTTHHDRLVTPSGVRTVESNDLQIGALSLTLSPGAHSRLIKDACEIFAPAYIPGVEPLYISDTRNKMLYFDSNLSSMLNLVLDEHDKLPDVILYRRSMNIVYIIEAVTSVGPISESRKKEILGILTKRGPLTFGVVYITAFPDRRAFRRFAADIAWETKVWIAAEQFGIIHFDLISQAL